MPDIPSHDATQPDEARHTLTVRDVERMLAEAGVQRSHRHVLRLCQSGMLDAVKIPGGPSGEEWYVAAVSVPKAIGDLKEPGAHCLTKIVTGELIARTGGAAPNQIGVGDGGTDQHERAARGYGGGCGALPVGGADGQRAYPGRALQGGRLASQACSAGPVRLSASSAGTRRRKPTYGATIKDALVALWEASDRICGKRLKVMIPTLLPALERHGRLQLDKADHTLVLDVSAATIDRLLVDIKIAAAGGKRRRVGFYSAVRREVPIRTFNDWNDPVPGFCEVDMVAHGGRSVAGHLSRR